MLKEGLRKWLQNKFTIFFKASMAASIFMFTFID